MGCLVGGPNNIITSAVAADLADDPSIRGNNRALGTVTGIINGSGSVTAAFGQMAIPVLYQMGNADGVGYRYVWYFLIVCTILGTSLMGTRIYKELYPVVGETARPINDANPSRGNYSAIRSHEEKA
jgi:MFS family permease